MEAACLRHTEIPGTSKLFADFLYRFDRVAGLFPANPDDPEAYAAAAAQLDYPDARRAALVDALRDLNGDSPQLDRLGKPGTVAVVTGQQVGLFSGPCFGLYKALTAAKLAGDLGNRGIPAVPVFWMATEDHDAAEVNHCRSLDSAHRPVVHRVETGHQNGRPVGPIPLRHPPLDKLRSALGDLPHGDEIAALVDESYAPGSTLGSAFHSLMKRLLAPYGFVFLDPLSASIRRIAAPFLETAHASSGALHTALIEKNRALTDAGYHAQVKVDAKSSLFFTLEDGRRVPLRRGKPPAAEQLSPNALLRPVMQDYLLPTVAYVGGPAEVAYFAQSRVLHDNLLGRMPVIVARRAFTLLDARAAKLFSRYGLTLSSFFGGSEQLRSEIARQLVPGDLDLSLGETRDRVAALLAGLRGGLHSFDPTLAAALDTSGSKINYQLDKIKTKTSREAPRRNERAAAEADFLVHLLYPNKHL
ncbi:MAG: bacillithiol biosynthesis BshC, partial [bacterium]|nr:bacillithiol biosynthesis BshC [bacterium]